ncbi:MAG TPA: NAD-dependent epimerase/dehydratase family protein [Micromonosporaceae bacterium]
MNVIIFGATGMVGQGVLRECLLDPSVEAVLTVGRSPTGRDHVKLREIVRPDLFDLASIEDELSGWDACFFCLGVSSVRMTEADYRRTTYDLTLSVARMLAELNPEMTFVYVSGQGTDGTERGRRMWARVKGETENALFALPFRAYAFRPGFIQPMHDVRSRTRLYAAVYAVAGPLYPVLRRLFPRSVTTSEQIGRAMLAVARGGAPKRVLETADINALADK